MSKKSEIFPLRMSPAFKERIRKAAEIFDMNMVDYIRLAISEKLKKDGK